MRLARGLGALRDRTLGVCGGQKKPRSHLGHLPGTIYQSIEKICFTKIHLQPQLALAQPWDHQGPILDWQPRNQVQARISKGNGNEVWKCQGQTYASAKGADTEVTATLSRRRWKPSAWASVSASH